jgi:hypothetical protein
MLLSRIDLVGIDVTVIPTKYVIHSHFIPDCVSNRQHEFFALRDQKVFNIDEWTQFIELIQQTRYVMSV